MMRYWWIPILLLVAGCLGPTAEFHSIAWYDLAPPAIETVAGQPAPASLQILTFAMLGPYRTKMLHRQGPQQLVADEYARWAEPPEQLVMRQFYLAARESGRWARVIGPYGQPGDLRLSGTVLAFERTLDNAACCRLQVTLESRDGRLLLDRVYEATEPTGETTSASVAAAMSRAVDGIVGQVLADAAAVAQPAP